MTTTFLLFLFILSSLIVPHQIQASLVFRNPKENSNKFKQKICYISSVSPILLIEKTGIFLWLLWTVLDEILQNENIQESWLPCFYSFTVLKKSNKTEKLVIYFALETGKTFAFVNGFRSRENRHKAKRGKKDKSFPLSICHSQMTNGSEHK